MAIDPVKVFIYPVTGIVCNPFGYAWVFMLQSVWKKLDYRLNVCCVKGGANIEHL